MTDDKPISLTRALSRPASVKRFKLWLVGDTPLITHAWSEKAKREMLAKQVKAVKAGKGPKDPEAEFKSSLYEMGDEIYGFPATAFKKAIWTMAHKDKGIPKTDVMAGLWIDAELVSIRPALAGAICDMPLLRIHGSKPEMREDMVRVGAGIRKTAAFAYRAQFKIWAVRVTGKFNEDVLPAESIAFLIGEGGRGCGVGDWRNEKQGMFGAFHLATPQEEEAWDRFAAKRGPLPQPAIEEAV